MINKPFADIHPCYKDKRHAINWARKILRNKWKYVILDTETTGLEKDDEIIQIGVIDLDGNVLLNENICPTRKKIVPQKSTKIHGLTINQLMDCQTFLELKKQMKKVISWKKIISYNAEFDFRLFQQTYKLAGGFFPIGNWECAMKEYAKFLGRWDYRHRHYKWEKLKGGDHTAVGDCLAILKIIHEMANTPKPKKKYEIWVKQ